MLLILDILANYSNQQSLCIDVQFNCTICGGLCHFATDYCVCYSLPYFFLYKWVHLRLLGPSHLFSVFMRVVFGILSPGVLFSPNHLSIYFEGKNPLFAVLAQTFTNKSIFSIHCMAKQSGMYRNGQMIVMLSRWSSKLPKWVN